MKQIFIKSICFFTGADWRKFFPERWDLSKVIVGKQYGGNEGFVEYYTDARNYRRFVHGIDVIFYGDSFVVKSIVGWTRGGLCSIAINKEEMIKVIKAFK